MNTGKYAKDYTVAEMMMVSAAHELKDGETIIVGTGLPLLASLLAKKTFAPNIRMIYEAGIIDAKPARLPFSIMDPCLAYGSAMIVHGLSETFSLFLQAGYVDVGFIGGAQVDKYGNVNSTVIGEYYNPIRRLPGSGGANDIASFCKRTLIIMPHEKRRFVERVDYITSPGYLDGSPNAREKAGLRGGGPTAVVSTMGVLRFDNNTKEMYLDAYYPGITVEQIKANTGWDLKISPNVHEAKTPTEEEIEILRKLDPKGMFLRKKEFIKTLEEQMQR